MYKLESESDFPRENIVAGGSLTLDYIGGFKEFDALGARQKVGMEVGTSGIYLTYPLSQGLLGKKRGTKVFIPVNSIEYINIEQDRQVTEQQEQKSALKRAAVGSMIGGRRGATIGALSAMGNKTTTKETITYRYTLKFSGKAEVVQCSMGIAVEGSAQVQGVENFNRRALKNILNEKLVENGNFSALNKQGESGKSQGSDPYEELVKLKSLLDQGILTEEEFNAKKKQLLGL